MNAPEFVPEAGDLIWLNFDPTISREQAGRRPALVISPAASQHWIYPRLSAYDPHPALPDQRRPAGRPPDRGRNPAEPPAQHRRPGPVDPSRRRRHSARDRQTRSRQTGRADRDLMRRIRGRPHVSRPCARVSSRK
ncbi:MAG: type II toxin-antitoxin system PemK/MazF family toxin [Roseiarcus sp.]